MIKTIQPQAFSISLAFLLAFLALAMDTASIQAASNSNRANHSKRSTNLLSVEGCHTTLSKRAVGAIPISSGPAGRVARQAVARRAVGSVGDPGRLCDDHLRGLKTVTSTLRARSVSAGSTSRTVDSAQTSIITLPQESSAASPNVVSSRLFSKRSTGHPHRAISRAKGKPNTAEQWARARPW